jgi:hypothetical protein
MTFIDSFGHVPAAIVVALHLSPGCWLKTGTGAENILGTGDNHNATSTVIVGHFALVLEPFGGNSTRLEPPV